MTRGTNQYSAGILVLLLTLIVQKITFFSVCLLDVSILPPSGDLRITRFVLSWSHLADPHLDKVEKKRQFLRWAGARDVARRDKTEEAHM